MAPTTSALAPMALRQPPDGWAGRSDLAPAPDRLAELTRVGGLR